ncbi:hypothetical protein [Gilvibacter sediminis]|uniref:hypothetical protein n=1 Tax=Gilvibacter sediminis TaxID=379071 RepID=UPI002350E69D|nr:hypothetical protein [Gilvibacter sediminis]MDC7997551.1 hypothetical protein [Gilvibacter sediminis]
MTIEIIVFIAAILFGIVAYWRESKNNKFYRLVNKITHSKELQMEADNPKGFLYLQPFLMRLVWITAGFLLGLILVMALTPINLFVVQYFVSAIVGTLAGTYIASAFFVTKEGLSKENLVEAVQKGRDFIEDLAEGKPEAEAEEAAETTPEAEAKAEPEPEAPKKSARERLKDKGMIN